MSLDVVTKIVAPPLSYDLVDLATAKDELQIPNDDTSNDLWLARNISAISDDIRDYCGRPFVIETISDLFEIQQDPYPWQVPGGVGVLQLSRWPVALFAQLQTTADAPQGSTIIPLSDTSSLFDNMPVSDGTTIPAGAIIVAGSITPMQVTISQPLAADLADGSTVAFGLSVVQEYAVGTSQVLFPGLDYTVDTRRGEVVRLDKFLGIKVMWEAVPTTVLYSAGYQEIPPSLVSIALEWLTMRWKGRGRDPLLRSLEQPGIGVETYWVGGPPSSGGIPQSIEQKLRWKYRVPTVA
jgi:hypothetical protein